MSEIKVHFSLHININAKLKYANNKAAPLVRYGELSIPISLNPFRNPSKVILHGSKRLLKIEVEIWKTRVEKSGRIENSHLSNDELHRADDNHL